MSGHNDHVEGDDRSTRLTVSREAVHQRRRRAAAVGVLGGAALLVWGIGSLFAGSDGGGGGHSGFAARLARAGGSGEGSLYLARTRVENDAVKRTIATSPYIVRGGGERKQVALTFDDGPSEFTPRVLAILEEKAAPATFFTVGGMYSTYGANASRVHSAGFPLANHSWSHPQMTALSTPEQGSELERTSGVIENLGVPAPNLFRPPYGAYNQASVAQSSKRGMLVVLWDVDTLDWERPGADAIVEAALSQARSGSIVLMHDGGGDRTETIAALPRVIDGLRAKGFQLVTVPRLLADDPPRPGETPPPVGQA